MKYKKHFAIRNTIELLDQLNKSINRDVLNGETVGNIKSMLKKGNLKEVQSLLLTLKSFKTALKSTGGNIK